MEIWLRESCHRDITHTYCVCLEEKKRTQSSSAFFWGAFYPRPPKSKEVNEWNRESSRRFEAHGRRARDDLPCDWLNVSSLKSKVTNQRTRVEILAVSPPRLLRPWSLGKSTLNDYKSTAQNHAAPKVAITVISRPFNSLIFMYDIHRLLFDETFIVI